VEVISSDSRRAYPESGENGVMFEITRSRLELIQLGGDPDLVEDYLDFLVRENLDQTEPVEWHHVIPKSLKEEFSKESWNIVPLSLAAHTLAHVKLATIFPHHGKIQAALMLMAKRSDSAKEPAHRAKQRLRDGEWVHYLTDTIPVKDENGKCIRVSREEYSLGEYESPSKGTVLIRDELGCRRISKAEFETGCYTQASKGFVQILDKEGKIRRVPSSEAGAEDRVSGITLRDTRTGEHIFVIKGDSRLGDPQFIHLAKGFTTRINIHTGEKRRFPLGDPELESEEWVSPRKGKVSVMDSQGNKSMVDLQDPRYLSGELVRTGGSAGKKWVGRKKKS
jgi:hypothetical protein